MNFNFTTRTVRNVAIFLCTYSGTARSTCTLRLYGGDMPSKETLTNWTSANLPANFLVSILGIATAPSGIVLGDFTNVAAVNSGTATWFSLQLVTGMIFGDISDLNGDGMLKLDDPYITTGVKYGMQNFTLNFPMNYEL